MAMLEYGSAIRIKFMGRIVIEKSGDQNEPDRTMKQFELYVSEIELTAEDVLRMRGVLDDEVIL